MAPCLALLLRATAVFAERERFLFLLVIIFVLSRRLGNQAEIC
jgi:hypothetical protein